MDNNSTVKYIIRFSILGLLILVIGFTSCRKNGNLRWESDLMVPLLHSSLDVWDIFGDTNVIANSDNSMKLVLEEKVEMLNPDKIINAHDTLAIDLFNIPLYLKFAPGAQLVKRESSVTMDLDGMELNYARARVATMKFYVTNTVLQPLQVKYELLSSEKDGKHFEIIEDVPAATASGPSYTVKTIHLDGYNMDMTGDGSQVNTVNSRTTVWIHPNADTASITPTDTILIISTFDELKVDYAHGYFGQQDYLGMGSSFIDVFGNFKAGSFDLEEANAQLKISNFAGMDVQMSIDKLSTYNNNLQKEVLLNDPIIGKSINIIRATENGSSLEDVNPVVRVFDIKNSNLDALVENMPDSLLFNLSAKINPLGNVTSGHDFLYFDKGIEASIILDIPLNLSSNGIIIEDYSTLNFDKDKKLKSGRLIVYADNNYPFDLDIQFYIVDENRVIVDSLFTKQTHIPSGSINVQGVVDMPSKNVLEIPLSSYKIEILRKYSSLMIRAQINSSEHKSYQLYQNSNLDISIVGDVKYEI